MARVKKQIKDKILESYRNGRRPALRTSQGNQTHPKTSKRHLETLAPTGRLVTQKAMTLLTTAVRKALPPLYSQEAVNDPIARVKFFTADAGWTWYATEGSPDGDDFMFFGYVISVEREWDT